MEASKTFVESIIKRVNPLWLPQADGTGFVFANLIDCYVYVMDKCYEVAPKGYVDLYLVIGELYNWNYKKVVQFCEKFMIQRIGKRISLFSELDNEAFTYYKNLITALHVYFNTDFDYYAYLSAWEIHKKHILLKTTKITDYERKVKIKTEGNTQQQPSEHRADE